ncbi:hypothetical protein BaRGS_00016678 [Batillaria attramentaria]|uniref:Uncharacterized protein n=1 Tax=Batillaria attramentaria TaxID=370345 RepID=A0ABD0KXR3_9CAEN
MAAILHRHGVGHEDLDWARDTYQDLLADYRCRDKDVHSLSLDCLVNNVSREKLDHPDQIGMKMGSVSRNIFLVVLTYVSCLVHQAAADGSDVNHVPDFDNSLQDFEFVYHDAHNLLLTVYGDTCYLTQLTAGDVAGSARQTTENAVIQAIQSGKQNILHQLTLDQMRYTYQDRLADFHCLEKTIWRLSVSLGDGDD